MPESPTRSCAAFDGVRLIAAGPLAEVALAVKGSLAAGAAGPALTFDDATGDVVDLDLRGSDAEIVARLGASEDGAAAPHGRGRPRLGVVAREVTLLPRHWDWLAAQSGGASAALRRLVEAARRTDGETTAAKQATAAAYRFLQAMAGDFPGFEEAARALFAGDRDGFASRVAAWPADVQAYAKRLAWRSGASESANAG
jgi:hypothetical protein